MHPEAESPPTHHSSTATGSSWELPSQGSETMCGAETVDDVEQALLDYLSVLEKINKQGQSEGDAFDDIAGHE